jgi:hypothetical protein
MKLPILRRQRNLIQCAPIAEPERRDRAMVSALKRARARPQRASALSAQRAFDEAVANFVRATPISPEIAQWFANETLMTPAKRDWKKTARHPAILAIGLAVAVMATIFVITFMERLQDFPGAETARKLLLVASATRRSQLEALNTDAINLGDYFFMKYQMEHFDIPMEFADFRATGARVFDDDDGHRVAQVGLAESRMQFFLFAAEPKADGTRPATITSDWRYVENEGWSGAVKEINGVYFMMAMRGNKEDIVPYLAQRKR